MLSNLDNSSRSKCQDNSKHDRSRFKAEAKKKGVFLFLKWNHIQKTIIISFSRA